MRDELAALAETFHGYQGMELKRARALLAEIDE